MPDHFMKKNVVKAEWSGKNGSLFRFKLFGDPGALAQSRRRENQSPNTRLCPGTQWPVLSPASAGFHFLLWKNLVLVGSVIILVCTLREENVTPQVTERK